ncbi:MSMEG_0569 family flavin-dependent oxidoreductase [Algiphilus sp.]|uniref:MSMEG_0569 family flavin-dependent oxidoreductase n=1 Tax=Algiphilus sp. TaxID=1872431 RepID=UPI003C3A55B3
MTDYIAGGRPRTPLEVAVIGGGQAGLSISWFLTRAGIDHRVFERHAPGHEWRTNRWDSFCLVTPNWQCRLPGFPYPGDDPHGFMLRDEIVAYIETYAASFDPPLRTGVTVERVRPAGDGFDIDTSEGPYRAAQVVAATGGYHRPRIPRLAHALPEGIEQLHSSEYRAPEQLPEGEVLVVGTGQSGCQIAEDLHLAGRRVHLSVGSAPRSPRFYRGRDVTDWLTDSGYYAISIDRHPQGEAVREKTNHYLSGRGGGREIDLRVFATQGMQLYGRLQDVEGGALRFRPDLAANLDRADASAEAIKRTIDDYIAANGIDAPTEPPYRRVWEPDAEPASLDLRAAGITTVIWCTGFDADFGWLQAPVFDGRGEPVHKRGVTPVPGVYFLGLPWLHTWGSGRFSDVGDDAEHLFAHIQARARTRQTPLSMSA